jgi:hypothetical protein
MCIFGWILCPNEKGIEMKKEPESNAWKKRKKMAKDKEICKKCLHIIGIDEEGCPQCICTLLDELK